MNTTNEKIIEVEITADDLNEMRSSGVPEVELPELGIRRYRQASHVMKDKVAILLDVDIVDHFRKKAGSGDSEFYQKRINQTLRRAIESE